MVAPAIRRIDASDRVPSMFGNKSIAKRVAKAVDPVLRPDETKIASVYLHDPTGSDVLVELVGVPVVRVVKTWILTLTDQRLLVHEGDPMNAAKSSLLGEADRARVALLAAEPARSPKSLVLSIDGDAGHQFDVPLVWRKDAAVFADALRAP